MTAIHVVLRLFFAALMLTTGITKLMDMPGFLDVVASYQMMPAVLIAPSGWALMLTELVLGVWLLIGPALGFRLSPAALVIVLMHAMYLVWLAIALMIGRDLPNCGCFGVYWPRPLTEWTLVEDSILLTAAVLFGWLSWRAEKSDGLIDALRLR